MTTTLGELATLVRGEVHGEAATKVHGAKPLTEAGAEDITYLDNEKHLARFVESMATAAVVPIGLETPNKSAIRVADPLMAFVAIVRHFAGPPVGQSVGIHPNAFIDPTARLGRNGIVGPFAVIGAGTVIGDDCRILAGAVVGANCRVGNSVTLHPHVVLYENTVLGERVIIHSHSTIGADGFGYRFQNGRHEKIPQLGRVEIGDDVEIGANTAIDRSTFSATRIGTGTKIDNLIMIGHNCQIGRHNIIVSQTGLAGSSSTGDYVVIAGQVGVVDHVHVGDRSVIGGQAAVTKDVPPDSRMLGSPATPERDQKRILMSLHQLPEWRKELRDLQDRLRKAG